MAYKCKIFDTVNLTHNGHWYFIYIHMCKIPKDIGINKEKEMTANKEIGKW